MDDVTGFIATVLADATKIDNASFGKVSGAVKLAAGKTPNTAELDLEIAGIEVDEKHAIRVVEYYKGIDKR